MKKTLPLLIISLILTLSGFSQNPKLVIGIVVDQMKQDYLFRFDKRFGDTGFKRLQNEGFYAQNVHYNYIPTTTGPGHASIYTGTTPSQHGIVANDWYVKTTKSVLYCVEDSTVSAVGGSAENGRVSPRNLRTTTITDELKLTSNFRSKVIGISIKDRGSALPAGHLADGAYWYDDETGNFMTSNYYMNQLPEWVNRFNQNSPIKKYLKETWTTLRPLESYTASLEDNAPYEGSLGGKDQPTFPYDLLALANDKPGYHLLGNTPYGNSAILDFALAAIEGEQLGKDDDTDFLAISFSSTDYIGHMYGPNSIELEDTYIRLDLELGRLLAYLDQSIGKGQYLLFLTSDHGAVSNPQFLEDHRIPGGYYAGWAAQDLLLEELESVLGKGEWIEKITDNQVFLNHLFIQSRQESVERVSRIIANAILKIPEIELAFTSGEILTGYFDDPVKKALKAGYNQKISGDVLFTEKPGHLSGRKGNTGTSHGTGYTYDTHVPLLWYGSGIKKGSSVRNMNITDIAPTLSMLLHISLPASTSGQPIEELFK